jgi:hypothetical protein
VLATIDLSSPRRGHTRRETSPGNFEVRQAIILVTLLERLSEHLWTRAVERTSAPRGRPQAERGEVAPAHQPPAPTLVNTKDVAP